MTSEKGCHIRDRWTLDNSEQFDMHLTPFATSRRNPWCRAKSGCGSIVQWGKNVILRAFWDTHESDEKNQISFRSMLKFTFNNGQSVAKMSHKFINGHKKLSYAAGINPCGQGCGAGAGAGAGADTFWSEPETEPPKRFARSRSRKKQGGSGSEKGYNCGKVKEC